MKKITMLIAIALVIGLSSFGIAASKPAPVEQPPTEEVLMQTEVGPSSEACDEAMRADDLLARAGCCSWHGGVCGCSLGMVICCDGTPSPTCGC